MRCPTPGKKAYRSNWQAIGQAIGQSRIFGMAFRPYRCPCGKWHLSTKP